MFLFYQRLFNPAWQSTLSFAFSVQLQELIHPINLFMVPLITRSSDVGKELPESICRMFKSQVLQRVNDCRVILLGFVIVHFAWQRSQFTGPAHRNVVILYNGLRQFPLFAGPQPFFEITSFKMEWSMLSSANILFKREFSSSRSLSRLTSEASRPPYFDFHL